MILLSPFDLHVLGTPPAFILSQDQTLRHFVPPEGGSQRCTPAPLRGSFSRALYRARACFFLAVLSYHDSVVKVLPEPPPPETTKNRFALSATGFRPVHLANVFSPFVCLFGLLPPSDLSEFAPFRTLPYSGMWESIPTPCRNFKGLFTRFLYSFVFGYFSTTRGSISHLFFHARVNFVVLPIKTAQPYTAKLTYAG